MICRFSKIVIILIFALTVHEANAQETDQAEEDTILEPTESDTSSINYYKPDSVVLRSVPDSVVQRLQGEKAFAYANDPQFWLKEESQDSKTIFDYLVDFFWQHSGENNFILPCDRRSCFYHFQADHDQ